jgi:zinc D-Ala-D-Ala carboxypeptidase
MKLTKNFYLSEFLKSQTALRKGIDNTPSNEIQENIAKNARHMELIRTILEGEPIIISSGYRCLELNLAIGGSANSAHMTGFATDFTCRKFGTPREIYEYLTDIQVEYDQLILEYDSWIHISFDPQMRGQSFEIN